MRGDELRYILAVWVGCRHERLIRCGRGLAPSVEMKLPSGVDGGRLRRRVTKTDGGTWLVRLVPELPCRVQRIRVMGIGGCPRRHHRQAGEGVS